MGSGLRVGLGSRVGQGLRVRLGSFFSALFPANYVIFFPPIGGQLIFGATISSIPRRSGEEPIREQHFAHVVQMDQSESRKKICIKNSNNKPQMSGPEESRISA